MIQGASIRTVRLASRNDFSEWRSAARALLLAGIRPEAVTWADPEVPADLFAPAGEQGAVTGRAVGTVPPRFIQLGEAAICHSDPDRFALLYRLLWRLQKDKGLLEMRSDPDVGKLERRAAAVGKDAYKMKTGVQFSVLESGRYMGWYEPEHFVLERVAPFFAQKLGRIDWTIVTPYRSASCDSGRLSFAPGGADVGMRNPRQATIIAGADAEPEEDEMVGRMEIETRRSREIDEAEREEITSLADARAAVQGCTRCPLYEFATQAVFGEGPGRAEIMFVGEQPGDQEDLKGKPFVGPAGQLFDRAMKKVGLDRREVYVTNAVKHFKFVPRGKKRLHQRPDAGEIQACRFWLNLEREFVRPKLIVAMGATALRGVLGKTATISSMRGRPIEMDDGTSLLVTVHPSYLLRMPDRDAAAVELERFEDDIKLAQRIVETMRRRAAS
jgi:DNA polymerase